MDIFNSFGFMVFCFIAFTGGVAVFSYFKSRNVNREEEDGYYLAGRSLSGIVIASGLIMIDLSAMQLVGNNGQSVTVGMGVFAAQGLGYSGMVLAALFLIPKYLKCGITTMPEFYELRYDKFTRNLITIIMMVNYIIVMIPSALYAGAKVFIQIFKVDEIFGLTYFESLVVICVAIALIGCMYAIVGGLKSMASADLINGIGMLVGGMLITIFGFIFLSNTLGGDGSLMDGVVKFATKDPAMMNAINEWDSNEPWWPWPAIILGLTINNFYYWGCDQAIVQRCFGAKSLAHAQKGMIYAGLLTMITPFFLVIPGIIANLAHPEINWYENGDNAFPLLISESMPNILLGLFAACVFGAVLSTFNAFLNSASTIFAVNIYKGALKKDATELQTIKFGKKMGIVIAVISTGISPFLMFAGGIFTWVNSAIGIFSIPILVLTLLAIFSKRVPRYIGKIIIPLHIVAYSLVNFILPNFFDWFGTVFYMYWYIVFFVLDMLIAALLIKFKPLSEDFELKENPPEGMDMRPWKNRKKAIVLILACTALVYTVFSPLCLGKSDQTTWERYQEYQNSKTTSQVVQIDDN